MTSRRGTRQWVWYPRSQPSHNSIRSSPSTRPHATQAVGASSTGACLGRRSCDCLRLSLVSLDNLPMSLGSAVSKERNTDSGRLALVGPSGITSILLGGRPRPRFTPGGKTGTGIPAAIIAAFLAAARPGLGPGLPLRVPLAVLWCCAASLLLLCDAVLLVRPKVPFDRCLLYRGASSLESSSSTSYSSYSSSDDGGEYDFTSLRGRPGPRLFGFAAASSVRASLLQYS